MSLIINKYIQKIKVYYSLIRIIYEKRNTPKHTQDRVNRKK